MTSRGIDPPSTVCFRHRQAVPSRCTGHDLVERQEAILALLDRADDGLALCEIRAELALAARGETPPRDAEYDVRKMAADSRANAA